MTLTEKVGRVWKQGISLQGIDSGEPPTNKSKGKPPN